MNRRIFAYFFLSVTLSSCYYNSRLVYLQNKSFSEIRPTVVQNKRQVYRLQPADVLSVQVKSSTETEIYNSIFNVSTRQNGVFTSPSSLYLEGYTVDSNGKINLPIIGEIVVKDLTVEEAQRTIQTNANKYLNKATVIVKLTSFKVTVLGEVKSPGYLYVYNDQVTILEALGMAGDLTPVASRKNIKLIRQVPAGSQVILLDLTDPKLLNSDYFYLLPNDVLYVEPLKARSNKTNIELLSLVFAGLTTAILVLNYVSQSE
jgi:polysaccharide export outer membrane protein